MPLEKAMITNQATGEQTWVLFNPEEYTIQRDNLFAQVAIPGLRAPLLQFVNGAAQTLEMDLLLDTLEAHSAGTRVQNQAGDDVRGQVARITRLLDIEPATHAPPVAVFAWASLTFTCVLTRATQTFTMFRPDGTPVRARLRVAFTEITNGVTEAKETKRETADYTKVLVVATGDRADAIAQRCYGSPALWRPIALANGIDDPRALRAGQPLRIPSLPYRDPDSGEVFKK